MHDVWVDVVLVVTCLAAFSIAAVYICYQCYMPSGIYAFYPCTIATNVPYLTVFIHRGGVHLLPMCYP